MRPIQTLIPPARNGVRLGSMRTGISIHVTASDRERLFAIVADRNSLQKHVWRARIVLLHRVLAIGADPAAGPDNTPP